MIRSGLNRRDGPSSLCAMFSGWVAGMNLPGIQEEVEVAISAGAWSSDFAARLLQLNRAYER